jgi:energy-coupling factor transport system ATP-binding protein
VLLTQPDVLLLDEPTKGFDAEFKVTFALILRRLIAQGTTILMVSHDVPFCAEYAHKCGLFFDGSIVAEGTPREFFSGNSFYTTPANRMARHLIPEAVTVADIIGCCGGEVPAEPPIPEATPLPAVKETAVTWKPKPLPLWRKLLAGVSLAVATFVFFYATGITNLKDLIDKNGISEAGTQQLYLTFILIAAMFTFIAAIGRRSAPSAMQQIPVKQRKLGKRTLVAAVLIVLCIPLTIFAGVMYLGNRNYNITALLVLLECMLPFFLIFEGRRPKARELVTIAVLCAIGVAGRAALFMLPQFKPVLALVIIAGVAFGGETGFLVGAVTMLVSNILFSQGPWTPWQMFSMGIIGFLAGVLFRKGLLRRNRGSLAAFGAFAAVVIYGGIMNPASALMYNAQSINWSMILGYYVTGLPVDLVHAAATVVFLLLIAEPMLEKLDRIKVKYGLVE